MTLQFPTIAEQVLAEFRSATKTVALATIARKHAWEVQRKWRGALQVTTYRFDDDTSLEVSGRGKAHKVEVFLP